MTLPASLMKLPKWLAGGVLSVLVLIGAAVAWIYYANSIEETPTCISFKASGALDAEAKVLAALPGVVESVGMKLTAERGASKVWQSDKATVTVYLSRDSGDYSVFVCQKQRSDALWQDVAKRVEQLLQGIPATALLQRNNRDFKCDPNCMAPLSMPIDFDLLNRTMLAHGGGS